MKAAKKSFGKAYRIDPNPNARDLCERLPVGFKFGNYPHGGFEILDGEASDYATSNAVLEEQAEIINVIAPFVDVDIYWGPSFRVWQHGKEMTDQQHVQLFTPYNAAKSIYKRRPCVLISTQALDRIVEAKLINVNNESRRDPYLEAAKVVACQIGYQLVRAEMYRHTHEEFFYALAEGPGRPRMESWEAAQKFLDDRWQGYITGWLSLGGVKKEDSVVGSKDLQTFHRSVFNGSMGRHLSRMNDYVETTKDLMSLLPPKPLQLPQESASALVKGL